MVFIRMIHVIEYRNSEGGISTMMDHTISSITKRIIEVQFASPSTLHLYKLL